MRCKLLDGHFFIDDLFSTKKDKKFLLGTTYYKLFLTEKDIVCVLPRKCNNKVVLSIKKFVNEIEDLDEITMDSTRKEKSQMKKVFQ